MALACNRCAILNQARNTFYDAILPSNSAPAQLAYFQGANLSGPRPPTRSSRNSHPFMKTEDNWTYLRSTRLCHISGFYLLLLSSRREPSYAIPMP
jgi:hypothetical protein